MTVQEFYPIYQSANKVVIDNRKIEKDDIFFAFSGENFDAGSLAEKAIEQGAKAVIVEKKEYENTEKNIFFVPSTLVFLQDLAKYHREQLNIPIIALTGSNGKTTTKELIYSVLASKYRVQYTQGNLNNHIGVPLTLLSIQPEHEMAVVEMGANHQKEIELLCQIAQPNIGYITNFGKAHLEGFGGFQGVIKGKSELYDYLKNHHQKVLINDNDTIQTERIGDYPNRISFGASASSYEFEKITKDNLVGIAYQGKEAVSQLTGEYNFTNLCAAVTLGLHFGIEFSSIAKAIEKYTPTNMRSQIVKRDGYTLVLDTYNANPSSMTASLQNFSQFQGSKIVVLGDMLELGEESHTEHLAILDLAKSLEIGGIFTIGKHFTQANPNGATFETTNEFIEYLKVKPIVADNILLKGSRGIALEKVIDYL